MNKDLINQSLVEYKKRFLTANSKHRRILLHYMDICHELLNNG